MEEVNGRLAQLEHLVAEADEADAPFEIPDFLTCKISMVLPAPFFHEITLTFV